METAAPLRKVSVDDDICVEDHNELVDAVIKNRIIPGSGLTALQTEGGLLLSAPFQGQIIHAVSPSTGIGVATSTTQMTGEMCVVQGSNYSGAVANAGYSVMVWNKSTSSPVGNSKPIMACFDGACWVAFWEAC